MHKDVPAPLAYSINDLVEQGPVGKSTIYNEIAAGRLIARKIGRRTIVLADDWRSYLAALRAITPAKAPAAAVPIATTGRRPRGRPRKIRAAEADHDVRCGLEGQHLGEGRTGAPLRDESTSGIRDFSLAAAQKNWPAEITPPAILPAADQGVDLAEPASSAPSSTGGASSRAPGCRSRDARRGSRPGGQR
jgi:hypothetical protein